MGPRPDPVTSDTALPKRADVVVIGGGIIGAATAFFLAEHGLSVALLEKGQVAGEQSGRNWGFCRQQGRDPRELPLIIESLRLWRELDKLVEGETGFRQAGVMYLAHDEATAQGHAKWLDHARHYQLDTRHVAGAELAALLPGAARQWPGALYTASDGRAEPQKAAPAVANAVRRRGGAVVTQCAARGLETSAGRVSTVISERGAIACNAAVLAGGAWSRLFCRNLGIALPQLTLRGSVFRTSPVEGAPETSLWATGPSGFATRRRLDGGYNIAHGGLADIDLGPDHFRQLRQFWPAYAGERSFFRLNFDRRFLEELRQPKRWALDAPSPFEQARVLDPQPSSDLLDIALGNLRAAFPAFYGARVEQQWAGYIDGTPDAIPIISAVGQLPGFFVSTGFSGHGFGIGPGAGRLMADLVAGVSPIVDPTPYRYSRFFDGSKIQLIGGY